MLSVLVAQAFGIAAICCAVIARSHYKHHGLWRRTGVLWLGATGVSAIVAFVACTNTIPERVAHDWINRAHYPHPCYLGTCR